jgi:hypothetical protein
MRVSETISRRPHARTLAFLRWPTWLGLPKSALIAIRGRRGTGSLLSYRPAGGKRTRLWREADSNCWSRPSDWLLAI